MKHFASLAFLLFSFGAFAQWELMTPIKTRSEFPAIKMVSDAVGYAIDDPLGAILRTHDGGAHWERMVNGLSDDPRAMHWWDAQRGIVVGESGSVYRTTDGFATIAGSNDPSYGHLSCVFFINDTLGWMGSESGRIYRSTDGGASWALTNSGQGSSNYMTAIQFLDTEVGYASCAGGGKVLKSTDGGLNWQNVGPTDQLVLVNDLHFYNDQLGVGVGSAGEVIRTTDGGATWDSIPSNTTYTMNDLDVQGDVMVACGWWGRTIRSTDAGLTWTEVQVGGVEHRSVSLLPSGAGLLGTDGRIMCTHDMGLTWELLVEGTWHTRINKVSFMDADTGVAIGWATMGGFEGGLLRTTDGGRHWSKAGGGGLGVHLSPEGDGCLGGSSGAFARTTDGFATRLPGNGPDMAIRCAWSFDASTHLVGGGHVNGGIYRTTDSGLSWTRVLDQGNIIISDLYFVNDLLGFAVGEDGNSHRTMDGGLTWEDIPAGGGHTVFFVDEQHGWTKNFRTTDGGDTWIPMGGTPQSTMSLFFTDPDKGYAVSSSAQTVRTMDGGITWENILPEITNALVGDAALVDGYIVIGCNNGDIFRAQVACPSAPVVPLITDLGGSLCTTTNGTVQWYLDDEPLPDGDTPCIDATEPGLYHVVVTDALGCVSAPSATVQVVSTGLHTADTGIAARLVPNPATLTVRLTRADASPALLTFLDSQGRTVRTERIRGNDSTIDVSGLTPGLYLLRVAGPDDVDVLRLVKE